MKRNFPDLLEHFSGTFKFFSKNLKTKNVNDNQESFLHIFKFYDDFFLSEISFSGMILPLNYFRNNRIN